MGQNRVTTGLTETHLRRDGCAVCVNFGIEWLIGYSTPTARGIIMNENQIQKILDRFESMERVLAEVAKELSLIAGAAQEYVDR